MAARAPRDDRARSDDAELAPYELAVFDDDGDPLPIWPCRSCEPWHIEVVLRGDGDVIAREWHAVDCPHLFAISTED